MWHSEITSRGKCPVLSRSPETHDNGAVMQCCANVMHISTKHTSASLCSSSLKHHITLSLRTHTAEKTTRDSGEYRSQSFNSLKKLFNKSPDDEHNAFPSVGEQTKVCLCDEASGRNADQNKGSEMYKNSSWLKLHFYLLRSSYTFHNLQNQQITD